MIQFKHIPESMTRGADGQLWLNSGEDCDLVSVEELTAYVKHSTENTLRLIDVLLAVVNGTLQLKETP